MKRLEFIFLIVLIALQLWGCTVSNKLANHEKRISTTQSKEGGNSSLPKNDPNNTPTQNISKQRNLAQANEGIESRKEEWVYYINETDHYKIYKKNRNGNDSSIVCDDERVTSLSVLKDWIYYTIFDEEYMLFKIKTDGTLKQKVCDADFLGDPVEQEITSKIEGNWIIFDIVPYRQESQNEEQKKEEDERVKNATHTFRVSLDGKEYNEIK